VLLGVALPLTVAEGVLRLVRPVGLDRVASELTQFRSGGSQAAASFEVDPMLGFVPRLGRGTYSEWGTLANDYSLAKPEGVTRLLFIGDSVTRRGRIIEALESVNGDSCFEYWNAGVESFATVQEVGFYRRHNEAIRPDHIILTFHLNDFQTTPVAFLDDGGRLRVYVPQRRTLGVSRTLLRHSHLYRLIVGLLASPQREWDKLESEVATALAELRDAVGSRRLSVLIHPILRPRRKWKPEEAAAYEAIIPSLPELGIPFYDLWPTTEQALADDIVVSEKPGDSWHPSAELARRYARFLAAEGLLEPCPDAPF